MASLSWVYFAEIATAQTTKKSTSNKYALMIGVTKYNHAVMNGDQPLKFPEEDARALGDLLSQHGYDVDYLLGEQATRENVLNKLAGLSSKGNSSGVCVVGLFGHGVEVEFSTSGKQGKEIQGCFCPFDTGVRQAKDPDGKNLNDENGKPMVEPTPDSLVKMSEVVSALGLAKAGSRLLVADCCREMPNRARGRNLGLGANFSTDRLPSHTAMLFGCRPGERALERDDWQHGAFTKSLLEVLGQMTNGNDPITTGTLADRVKKKVQQLTNNQQNPTPISLDSIDLKFLINETSEATTSLTNSQIDALYRQAETPILTDDPKVLQSFLAKVAPSVKGSSFPIAIRVMREQRRSKEWILSEDLANLQDLANSIDPDSQHTWLINGWFASERGDTKLAREAFTRAVQKNPLLVEAHLGLVWIDEGGDAEAGTAYAKKLVQKFPKDHRVYNAYGTRLFNENQWEEGLVYLEQAVQLSPNNPNLWNNKAYGLFGAGRKDEAAAAYQKTVELAWNQSADYLVRAGWHVALEGSDQVQALKIANRAIELNDQLANAWLLLIQMYADSRNGDQDKAISTFDRALGQLNSRESKLRILDLRVSFYLNKEEISKAEVDVKTMERLANGDISLYGVPKAQILRSKGQNAEALKVIDQVLAELQKYKGRTEAKVIAEHYQKELRQSN